MTFDMMISKALGVLILARNGDHLEFLQDLNSYELSFMESTPLSTIHCGHLLLLDITC